MTTQKRLCDYCGESIALLYCRADSANLCFTCDRDVHSDNLLFRKHTRFHLCDACDASPASISCTTENSILCQNCDWECHSSLRSLEHDRRPLEGFIGCPSAAELSAIFGLDVNEYKSLVLNNGTDGRGCRDWLRQSSDSVTDMLLWDPPAVVSLDDLISSTTSSHNFQAAEVPSFPKNRNVAFGQHKEEILRQLCKLEKLESNMHSENVDPKSLQEFEPVNELQRSKHVNVPIGFVVYEANTFQCRDDDGDVAHQLLLPNTSLRSYLEENSMVPDKGFDIVGHPNHANAGNEVPPQCPVNSDTRLVLPKVSFSHELSNQDRETAISRYKEKKKTRRYDRHIRYESRKIRAESRTRIKGRFAKMDH